MLWMCRFRRLKLSNLFAKFFVLIVFGNFVNPYPFFRGFQVSYSIPGSQSDKFLSWEFLVEEAWL